MASPSQTSLASSARPPAAIELFSRRRSRRRYPRARPAACLRLRAAASRRSPARYRRAQSSLAGNRHRPPSVPRSLRSHPALASSRSSSPTQSFASSSSTTTRFPPSPKKPTPSCAFDSARWSPSTSNMPASAIRYSHQAPAMSAYSPHPARSVLASKNLPSAPLPASRSSVPSTLAAQELVASSKPPSSPTSVQAHSPLPRQRPGLLLYRTLDLPGRAELHRDESARHRVASAFFEDKLAQAHLPLLLRGPPIRRFRPMDPGAGQHPPRPHLSSISPPVLHRRNHFTRHASLDGVAGALAGVRMTHAHNPSISPPAIRDAGPAIHPCASRLPCWPLLPSRSARLHALDNQAKQARPASASSTTRSPRLTNSARDSSPSCTSPTIHGLLEQSDTLNKLFQPEVLQLTLTWKISKPCSRGVQVSTLEPVIAKSGNINHASSRPRPTRHSHRFRPQSRTLSPLPQLLESSAKPRKAPPPVA